MNLRSTESEYEDATLERLEFQGFIPVHASTITRDPREVVLTEQLSEFLLARYPKAAADQAQKLFPNPQGVDRVRRNQEFLRNIARGIEVAYEDENKERKVAHVYPIDWDHPEENTFRAVNQLTVKGRIERRPDIVVYVNGIPLVIFELKNPYDENPTVEGAYNQFQHYQEDIPQLFDFNAFCVVSDGIKTLHGMPTAGMEWWAEWKSVNGTDVAPGSSGTMKTLIEGLFTKERLLSYVRHFILFESEGDKLVKKGARYHQFFVVRAAALNAEIAFGKKYPVAREQIVGAGLREKTGTDNNRLGVVWHTQGSGKSLEMVFLVGILLKALNNPLIVIQVDAKALDEQLYGQFVQARWLVGEVTQAESIKDLRAKLQTEAGGVVFTTLQKFDLLEGETVHPPITKREDVIVIADEAHRSQYGLTFGLANNLRRALPKARYLGFTGTPIEFGSQNTPAVFGDYILPIYDIQQSVEDHATVPLYYEARLARLHLTNPALDQELGEVLEEQDLTEEEARIARWAQMEEAAGVKDRMEAVAKDIVQHFEKRAAEQFGKAMIVCMSRRNCVAMYNALADLRPGWADPDLNGGEMKIVMTSRPDKDPIEWNHAGHVTGAEEREHLADRLKDEDDKLKLVIVRDMWLTGFDAPLLNTLYVDKPMKGHNLMQAVARINRVFKDKPGGLIVDYIGIAHYLQEATARYTTGGGRGNPAPPIDTEGMEQFLEQLESVREICPESIQGSEDLSKMQLEDLQHRLLDALLRTDELRDDFLLREKRLASAASLVGHLQEAAPYLFETSIYQRVRALIRKTLPQPRREDIDTAVKALVDKSVESEDVVDIFQLAGLPKADISILDDNFLQEFATKEYPNLRMRLLEKLIHEKIQLLARTNPIGARSFSERLAETLDRYHNNALSSAQLIQLIIQMRKQMESDSAAKEQYGFTDEELAFYDTLVLTGGKLYDQPFLAELVRSIVPAIRENLRPDWTRASREDIQAMIRSAVRRVLIARGVRREDFDLIIARIMEHAQAVYADWPQMPLS